nr:hypothetical protein [uncultured Sphingorhabdus sp.]
MNNLAQTHSTHCPGDVFVRDIIADGSRDVIAPLQSFLETSAKHPDLRSSAKTARAALLADIAHFMHISHGRHPGVIDYAAQKIVDDAARSWLITAINGIAAERAMLNRLTVTAGPIRRLSGQGKVNALVEGQAKSFQMLATSDRKGCPAGAAIAFVVDWHQTRGLLDIVTTGIGLDPVSLSLPPVADCMRLASELDDGGAYRRAMSFGAQQMLAQQRGLWQLIVARHLEMLSA